MCYNIHMSTTKKVLLVIGIVILLAAIGFGLLIYKGVKEGPRSSGRLDQLSYFGF